MVALDGLAKTDRPDFIHEPVAHPGAFGGHVACVLARNDGRIEQYYVELLPEGDATTDDVIYKSRSISYFMRFNEADAQRKAVANCGRRDDNGLVCRVDLGAGDGLNLVRFFNADLQLTGLRLMAIPEAGMINSNLWDIIAGDVGSPDTALELDAQLPAEGKSWSLARSDDSRPGRTVYGISGEIALQFMQAIYGQAQEIIVETKWRKKIGDQISTTSSKKTIPEGNVAFLISRLGAVEQLMVAGFEASKDLKF